MTANPYESPATTGQRQHERWFGRFEMLVLAVFALLLVAAAVHRLQFDDAQAYVRSPLVTIELLGIPLVLAVVPVALVRSVLYALKRRFGRAIVNLFLANGAFAVVMAVFWIDYPLNSIT